MADQELEDYARRLFKAAVQVCDELTHHVDHYTWDGSMNQVEDLSDLLEEGRWNKRLSQIMYPPGD